MILYYDLAGRRSAYEPRLIRAGEGRVVLRGLMPLRPGLRVEVCGPVDPTPPCRSPRSRARVVACRCGTDGLFDIQLQLETA